VRQILIAFVGLLCAIAVLKTSFSGAEVRDYFNNATAWRAFIVGGVSFLYVTFVEGVVKRFYPPVEFAFGAGKRLEAGRRVIGWLSAVIVIPALMTILL